MKKTILSILLFTLCGNTIFSQGFFKLDFSDEFNGTRLNTNNWRYQTGESGWGNNEKQYYTSGDNVTVRDGYLIITAKRENRGNSAYTSSRINTSGKYSTTYGRIEARISLPIEQGLWPAFWMMPEKSVYGGWAASGEIDIMEAKGRFPNQYSGALHFGGAWPSNTHISSGDYTFKGGKTIEDFHVYAVEWKEGEFTWYCDDQLVHKRTSGWYTGTQPFPAPFDEDFHILLNMAVGGNFDGGVVPSGDWQSGEMKVDYVRVYKWSDTLTEKEIPEDAGLIVEPNEINIARNKSAMASSTHTHLEEGVLSAANVTDGLYSTRWGSKEENQEFENEWIRIDLQEIQEIDKLIIEWESAYAKTYEVRISDDLTKWETIYTTTNGEGYTSIIRTPFSARHIMVYCRRKSLVENRYYGYSILEIEAYGAATSGINDKSLVENIKISRQLDEICVDVVFDIKKIYLYTIEGRLVAEQTKPTVNIAGMAKGVYTLIVQDVDNFLNTFKIAL